MDKKTNFSTKVYFDFLKMFLGLHPLGPGGDLTKNTGYHPPPSQLQLLFLSPQCIKSATMFIIINNSVFHIYEQKMEKKMAKK